MIHTPATDAEILRLWQDGVSSSDIAAAVSEKFQIKCSKNMLIGRRNRLGATKRDSPIASPKWSEAEARIVTGSIELSDAVIHAQLRVAGFTRSIGSVEEKAKTIRNRNAERRALGSVAMRPIHIPPPQITAPLVIPRRHGCLWPMWGHNERYRDNPRFCDGVRDAGRSYCWDHARIAYTNLQNERNEL